MTRLRRTPNKHLIRDGSISRRNRFLIGGVVGLIIAAMGIVYALGHWEHHMAHGRWRHLLLALGLGSAAEHLGASVPASPVPPTTIGINLSPPAPFRQARAFANLAMGGSWQSRAFASRALTRDEVDSDGTIKQLPGDKPVYRLLVQPSVSDKPVRIRCTYSGQADIRVSGKTVRDSRSTAQSLTFDWSYAGNYKDSLISLSVSAIDAARPFKDLDCRVAAMARNVRFDPEFLALVRPFKVIRFMDWQNTNANLPTTWAARHTPASLSVLNDDGVSIEDMMDLVNQTDADPWFNMPWNGDSDYIRRFAQYVHDHLPRGRKVYVEAGNEVWNTHFPMSKQALAEGVSEGLSANPESARLYRYAERLVQIADIWAQVFADRPGQLVRVANCQNGPNRSNTVLSYKDTAKHIDALATAPYFSWEFRARPPANADEAFARMDNDMDDALATALKSKSVADKFGKRYIAYEAGQHVVLPDLTLAQSIQRDPRMYDAYKRYLGIWRGQIGDTIMMYDSVQPIVKTGAFGLLEYLGQPLSDAPKMRAVSEAVQGQRH